MIDEDATPDDSDEGPIEPWSGEQIDRFIAENCPNYVPPFPEIFDHYSGSGDAHRKADYLAPHLLPADEHSLDDPLAHPRITVDPAQMGGVPCIRGLRIPVVTVVRCVAQGFTTEEILRYYPDLEVGDTRAALLYAADVLSRRMSPEI